jgi:plastocyanin
MNDRLSRRSMATPLLVAALLAACSNSSENSSTIAADVRVVSGASLLGFQAFSPDTFTVDLGTAASVSVSWRNDDNGVVHTVTDTATVPLFATGNIATADTAMVTFTAPGSYGYRCSIHPTMQGLVIVTDTVP